MMPSRIHSAAIAASDAQASADPGAGETALLRRLRAGDEAAFEAWVRAETPRLLAATRRILRSDEDARDAVQETFLHAFRALPGFAGESRLSTWLHRIAINAALMQLRRRRRKPEESIEELLPGFTDAGSHAVAPRRWPELPDPAERAELRRALEECCEQLPESYRLILLLRDVEGLDTGETAAALGIGREAVKVRLHRARRAARALLEPYVLDGLQPARCTRLAAGTGRAEAATGRTPGWRRPCSGRSPSPAGSTRSA